MNKGLMAAIATGLLVVGLAPAIRMRTSMYWHSLTEHGAICQAWKRAYNPEGIELTRAVLDQYPIFPRKVASRSMPLAEAIKEELQITTDVSIAYARLRCDPIPENFSSESLFNVFALALESQEWLRPQIISHTIGLSEHPQYRALRELNPLTSTDVLNTALGITHEWLAPTASLGKVTLDRSWSEFYANIQSKEGDCSEYTFLAATIYYAACQDLHRDDLLTEIRIATGLPIQPDVVARFFHNWLQIRNGEKWMNVELYNSDFIRGQFRGEPLVRDMGDCICVPLLTQRAGTDRVLRYRYHVTPCLRNTRYDHRSSCYAPH